MSSPVNVVLVELVTVFGPAAPVAPVGMLKSSTAAELVPALVTEAELPTVPVVVEPTLTIAVTPGSPRSPVAPAIATFALIVCVEISEVVLNVSLSSVLRSTAMIDHDECVESHAIEATAPAALVPRPRPPASTPPASARRCPPIRLPRLPLIRQSAWCSSG